MRDGRQNGLYLRRSLFSNIDSSIQSGFDLKVLKMQRLALPKVHPADCLCQWGVPGLISPSEMAVAPDAGGVKT